MGISLSVADAFIVDTETSDLNTEVVELAFLPFYLNRAIVMSDLVVKRYNPGRPIAFGAQKVHGISDSMVRNAPSHTTLRLPVDRGFIVGHNISYDIRCIRLSGFNMDNFIPICTLKLARVAFLGLDSYKLTQVTAWLASRDGDDISQWLNKAHSASADVALTHYLLDKIIKEFKSRQIEFDLLMLSDASNFKVKPTKVKKVNRLKKFLTPREGEFDELGLLPAVIGGATLFNIGILLNFLLQGINYKSLGFLICTMFVVIGPFLAVLIRVKEQRLLWLIGNWVGRIFSKDIVIATASVFFVTVLNVSLISLHNMQDRIEICKSKNMSGQDMCKNLIVK